MGAKGEIACNRRYRTITSGRGDGDSSGRYSDVKRGTLESARSSTACRLPTSCKNGFKTAVYVIDGQSTDNTREIAVEKGAQLILEERQGKGQAIQTAFKSITADYAIMVDGDDTYPIEMATEMTRLLQTHDVVIGSRLKGTIEPGAMTRLNVVGNTLLSLLARVLFGVHISDVCTGFWGYRSDAVRRMELAASGFEIEADMFAECVRKDLRIAEIPITYRARKDQPKLSSMRDGIKIGLFLCKRRFKRASAR